MTSPRPPSPSVPVSDTQFSSPTFSAIAWVNSLLSSTATPPHLCHPLSSSSPSTPSSPSVPETDALASHQAVLASARASAHADLDAALASALAAVPWVVRECEKVRQRAAAVRAGVDGVGERVAGVEGSVSASVARIAEADMLVRRVEGTAGMLGQVSAADVLLGRLGSLLGSGSSDGSDLVSAADVVAELRAALEALRGVEGMEGRFGELDSADDRLGELAEPRLRAALEKREGVGARNARIVFDRAGRAGAFCGKYVELRQGLIGAMWSDAWVSSSPASTGSFDAASDLASTRAGIVLDAFFNKLVKFVHAESSWLGDVFPDLRPQLLPALLVASMNDPSSPSVDDLRPRPATVQVSGISRMHQASLRATKAAAEVAQILVRDLNETDYSGGGEFATGGAAERTVERTGNRNGGELERGLSATSDVLGAAMGGGGAETSADRMSNVDATRQDLAQNVLNAVVSLLFPCSVFWSVWPALAASTAETAALAIPFGDKAEETSSAAPAFQHPSLSAGASSKFSASRKPGFERARPPIPLSEIAKLLQAALAPLLAIVDSLESQISDWTVGLGVLAVPAATSAASSVISRRAIALIQREQQKEVMNRASASGDDWGRVAGALSLLRVVSSLKLSWESRKEVCNGVAGEPASSMLEVALALRDNPRACVTRLLELADTDMWAEASAVMQLVLNDNLSSRVARTIQGRAIDVGGDGDIDGRAGELEEGDFTDLIKTVHDATYKAMFSGILQRFRGFEEEASWGDVNILGDGVESMAGFSSSPLSYATEIADYMMTIPQQLEPYVPEEDEDDVYSTPSSVFAFSAIGADRGKDAKSGPESNEPSMDSPDGGSAPNHAFETAADDAAGLSFAGMWIGAVAVGTMELYVEKMLSLTRLSKAGAEQLVIDAEYICNVLAALGVVPIPKLDLCRRVLDCPLDVASFRLIRDEREEQAHRTAVDRIAFARGCRL